MKDLANHLSIDGIFHESLDDNSFKRCGGSWSRMITVIRIIRVTSNMNHRIGGRKELSILSGWRLMDMIVKMVLMDSNGN